MSGSGSTSPTMLRQSVERLAPSASEAQEALLWMINGAALTQIVRVAVELRLPDLLHEQPMTCAEIAKHTGAHFDSIRRLVRALASLGVLDPLEGERYCLAPIGECLRSGVSDSLRAVACHAGDASMQMAWAALLDTVRTGQPAFDSSFGMDYGTYLARNAEAARIFHERSRAGAARIIAAVLAVYDFSRFSRIVDVGGGYGHLVIALLQSYQDARGVVFDLPSAQDGARELIRSAGVENRCDVVVGSVFDAVPCGGDLYVLKSMLHGWDDNRCIDLLKNCRRAMSDDAVLMVVERLVPDGERPPLYPALVDMTLLVLGVGRERTPGEYGSILRAAGFRVVRVLPTATEFFVLEAVPE